MTNGSWWYRPRGEPVIQVCAVPSGEAAAGARGIPVWIAGTIRRGMVTSIPARPSRTGPTVVG